MISNPVAFVNIKKRSKTDFGALILGFYHIALRTGRKFALSSAVPATDVPETGS